MWSRVYRLFLFYLTLFLFWARAQGSSLDPISAPTQAHGLLPFSSSWSSTSMATQLPSQPSLLHGFPLAMHVPQLFSFRSSFDGSVLTAQQLSCKAIISSSRELGEVDSFLPFPMPFQPPRSFPMPT